MINLMYVLLMAMLALNVSKDVLNGFTVVEDSLNRTIGNTVRENGNLYRDFAKQARENPAKVRAWYGKALAVRQMSDSLYNYAQQLKWDIAREADGEEADLQNLVNKADEDAVTRVMLAPVRGQGPRLRAAIEHYRTRVCGMLVSERDRATVMANLSTTVPRSPGIPLKNRRWEEYTFGNMPAVAAIMMLTKLQHDVRLAEGQVLHSLLTNVDLKDVRVNSLDAYVIPEATTLYPGQAFRSRIIMAAVDTTRRPEIYVNGRRILGDGTYNFTVGGPGQYSIQGYIRIPNAAGEVIQRPFRQSYNVIAPPSGAAVAADLMNVLYAGFNNPITVSASGVPSNKVSVSMQGGSLTPAGTGKFIARPSAVGKPVTFSVSGEVGGRMQPLGEFTFQVRKLPDPTAYIRIGDDHFAGGRLAKARVLSAPGIGAAIDDGLLNIPFRVLSFETTFFDNMGNARPETASGDAFTENQRNLMRSLRRGQRFYISNVKAVGPDGITRTLPQALPVIVN